MTIRIDRVITRGGDGGQTSLGDGTRVPKDALRVEAYGTVDEANAAIGLLRLHTAGGPDEMLARIQNDLFDVGSDLCVPGEAGDRLRVTDAPSARLEAEVVAMNASLPALTSFVLPGGVGWCGARASGPDGGAPGRTAGGGAGAGRCRQPGGDTPAEPPIGPSVRAGPGC